MNVNPNLLSLPEEVVQYMSNFLKLQDLLALSATCRCLRSALNCNSVWRKYSRGGAVSHALKGVTSVVEPTFTDQEDSTSTLEPLCEQKIHFLRQTRLFGNYCKGKFVQSHTPFEGYLSDFETLNVNLFSDRQITYMDEYLFALDYCVGGVVEEIKVYNIKEAPCLQGTFKLIRHGNVLNYSVIILLKVVENKLVVRQDNWFDVYEIKVPEFELSFLHSIDVRISPSIEDSSLSLLRHFIIVENHSSSNSNVVHVWNICSGKRLDDIKPKVEGSDFKICNHPGDKQDILFSVEVSVGGGPFITPNLFIYSLQTLQYTNFFAILPFKSVPTNPLNYFGLLDKQHVVLLNDRQELVVDVFVYDIILSTLLARKSMELMNKKLSRIVNGYLAVCKTSALEIVSLSNLETMWKVTSFEEYGLWNNNIDYFDILSLHHFILIKNSRSIEVWSVENRKKCFILPQSIHFIALSDSFSKLIVQKQLNLETLTFW